jgi:hypothetical protein
MASESCSVIELQPHDDLSSLRHRLAWADGKRVVLALPWDMRFLSRGLDFDLLRREVEWNQLAVAIVSPDPERRQLARRHGFPAFASVSEAQGARKWRSHSAQQVQPPPQHWYDAEISLYPRPVRPRIRWIRGIGVGLRIAAFLLVLAIVLASAYVIVPSGSMTLVPAGREFAIIVPVSVIPTDTGSAGEIDLVARTIPAWWVGIEIEGHAEVETTGVMGVISGRATGTVLFTNLLTQDYVVPVGTVVRTSSTSYPIRFRTTAEVAVPAAGQASAPVESLDEGAGNVAAFEINQVEGVAAYALRVTNPEATSGAEIREARTVAQADYDRLRIQLMRQLLDQAYTQIEASNLVESTEMLLRESLRIEAAPKQAYNRFIGEQADKVGLDMRVLVRGLKVDVGNARAVAYNALVRSLPPGHQLVDARYDLGEVAEEDVGPGLYTFFVTARGYAAAALDPGAAVELVRGQRVGVARERLQAAFPLAEAPRITIWPEWPAGLKWLERMPLLVVRIRVQVVPQEQPAGQATTVAR